MTVARFPKARRPILHTRGLGNSCVDGPSDQRGQMYLLPSQVKQNSLDYDLSVTARPNYSWHEFCLKNRSFPLKDSKYLKIVSLLWLAINIYLSKNLLGVLLILLAVSCHSGQHGSFPLGDTPLPQ